AVDALADVVVGLAVEGEAHAVDEEGAERLAGRTGEGEVDRAGRQADVALLVGDLAGEVGADVAVDVGELVTRHQPGGLAEDDVAGLLQDGLVERAFVAETLVALAGVVTIHL